MNFNWMKPTEVLNNDYAIAAENRLMSIKKAGKTVKKSVEESLRTSNSKSSVKNEELEAKKKRACEHVHGENLASASSTLSETKNIHNFVTSPLQTILEHYANLEKTLAHMLAANEMEVETLLTSDTPLIKLLSEEIPNYASAKKDLEHSAKKVINAHNSLEKEQRKLEKLELAMENNNIEGQGPGNNEASSSSSSSSILTTGENTGSEAALISQREKTEKLCHETESLEKDLNVEEAKVTSNLLSLTSRENRYAITLIDLIRLKKAYYENAFKTIEAELPNIERLLLETGSRPVFGEKLSDHLRATGRIIALPIHIAVRNLLDYGYNEEGIFRISPKQIKLDRLKAHLDANIPIVIDNEDVHLQCGLLKCYLRELPEPLLVTVDRPMKTTDVHNHWLETSNLRNLDKKLRSIRSILSHLTKQAYDNVQYLLKFLHYLVGYSEYTKMTAHNLSIVLGPNLLSRDTKLDQSKLDNVISIVVTLIQNYPDIFEKDVDLCQYDQDLVEIKAMSASSLSMPESPSINSKNNNLKVPSNNKDPNSGGESPSLNNKRRQSFRTFRKNIMAKLSPPSNINGPSLSPGSTHKAIIEKEHNSA